MKLHLRVLGGPSAGASGVFSQDRVTVGRHPDSHFPFDPERALDVSGRHAEFYRDRGGWYVQDVGSRNGTFVNGHRITRATKLDDTDQVRLGKDGPALEVRLVGDAEPDAAPQRAAARRPRPTGGATAPRGPVAKPPSAARKPIPAPGAAGGSTTQRIRIEVGRQTRALKLLTGFLLLLLVGVVGFFVVNDRLQQQARNRDVRGMQARIDSILTASASAIASLQGQVNGLATALQRSQTDVQRLQSSLERARTQGSDAEVDALRQQLTAATAAFEAQRIAAQVDYRAINDANASAVAMVWADFGAGDVSTGTAFAVRADGIMITNRHVVAGADGSKRPLRLAVQFTDSDQVWRGQLVAVDGDVDLAVLRVLGVRGQVPVVHGFDTTAAPPAVGEPVAIIGFPLGSDLPMRSEGEAGVVRSTFTAGTVSKVLPDLLQIDGYGAPGASGSPIFSRDGEVVGVLYGAEEGTSGRVVFGVPVGYAQELIRQIP